MACPQLRTGVASYSRGTRGFHICRSPVLADRTRPHSARCNADQSRGLQTTRRRQAEQKEQMRMLILGSPGSGKGTLSSRLIKRFPSLSVLTAGDVLRDHIRRGTDVGKEADRVIKAGSLMPDEVMMRLMGTEIEGQGSANWLLDGFPRTIGQAKLLDNRLEAAGLPLNLIINLVVPEGVILERILERYVHPASGRVYNKSFNPPKVEGKDDVTGEPLERRSDDNEETLRSRLSTFNRESAPILSHYGRLVEDFEGKTSDSIWPRLEERVSERFGG